MLLFAIIYIPLPNNNSLMERHLSVNNSLMERTWVLLDKFQTFL